MSKVRLTGSNSGYVEIAAAADAGNLTFTMPTTGTALFGNGNNVISGITTFNAALDINSTVDVSGASVFNNDVTFDGATSGYDVVWDRSDNQLEFATNAKANFGDAMQLYHNGSNSLIQDSGTGHIQIRSGTFTVGNFGLTKTSAIFNSGAEQELRFNNNTKFVTTNTGVVITGICTATSFSGDGSALSGTGANSNRNLIINGDMKITVRSFGPVNFQSAGYYTADRWRCQAANIGINCQLETYTPNYAYAGAALWSENHRRVLKISHSSAGTYNTNAEVFISQRIESVNIRNSYWDYDLGSGNAKLQLSFWARSSVAQTFYCWIHAPDSGHVYAAAFTISNPDTFQKFTIEIPSYGALDFNRDTGIGLDVRWYLGMGTGYTDNSRALNTWQNYSGTAFFPDMTQNWITNSSADFSLTGVQLEAGDSVTDYEKESQQATLLKCQRYYYQYRPETSYWRDDYQDAQATYSWAGFDHPVEMRADPTATAAGSLYSTNIRSADGGHSSSIAPYSNQQRSVNIIRSQNTGRMYTYWSAYGTGADAGDHNESAIGFYVDAEL